MILLKKYRWLYNHLLEKRRDAWEQEGKSLSLYQQQETFSLLKAERPLPQRGSLASLAKM